MTQRTGAFLRTLPDRALVDRLVRGRAWIPLLGVMLAGIVAMQVEVLKLGASVGRSIETGAALQTRNQLLRASVAALSDQTRIERLAAGMGMIMPAPGSAGFLSPRASLEPATANIHAPDPASFLASLAANGGVATTSIMSTSDGSIVTTLPGQSTSAATTAPTAASSTSSGTGATGTGPGASSGTGVGGTSGGATSAGGTSAGAPPATGGAGTTGTGTTGGGTTGTGTTGGGTTGGGTGAGAAAPPPATGGGTGASGTGATGTGATGTTGTGTGGTGTGGGVSPQPGAGA